MIENKLKIDAKYTVHDDRFTIDQIADSELIIELSQNFFRFAIKNAEQTFVWLEDYSLNEAANPVSLITQILEENRFLSVRFWKRIVLLTHSNQKTFLPGKLNEEQQERAFKVLFEENAIPFYAESTQGSFLMSVNDDAISYLLDFYGFEKVELKLAEQVITLKDKESGFALFHLSGLSLIFETKHFNTYWFENCERMLNFVINAKKNLKLVICGEVTAYSSEFRLLENKLGEIELAKLEYGIRLSQYFQETPIHRYYLILNS